MDEKDKTEVENIILEAKLDISESRFKLILYLAGGFLALFGVVLPIFLSWDSSGRVDKAIEKMENSFKELAGIQLRRPEIECYFNAKKLENSELSLDQQKLTRFQIKNIGDAPAKNVMVYIYIPAVKRTGGNKEILGTYSPSGYHLDTVESEFSTGYVFEYNFIDPKDSAVAMIKFSTTDSKECHFTLLLKVFYGQPEPKIISFTINLKSR